MQISKLLIVFLFSSCFYSLSAQDTSDGLDKFISFPDKIFSAIDKKSNAVEEKLTSQTEKYLSRIAKQENRLKKKLYKKDSLLAQSVFGDIQSKYNTLKSNQKTLINYANTYSGHLDSITTALGFVKNINILKHKNVQSLANIPQLGHLEKTLQNLNGLKNKFNQTEQISNYLQQRQQLLKEQFQKLGMVKELKKFRKQVYYYQAQVKEYKEIFEDPNKLEAKLMEVVTKIPAFKDFFAKNSELASLFALPGSSPFGPGQAGAASLQGLQTRASVNQALIDRFGAGPDVTQALQQNVQAAQGQLNELKSRVYSLSPSFGGGQGEADMPDFKPNNQKTKGFLQRLELGTNIQSQKARMFFPVTSDIGLSVGYKLNDKSIIGIGASYKVGWGRNWDNINITHQGVGLRSFIDYNLKGSLFISGGYEQNYRSEFNSIDQLKGYSAWQISGLVGLGKKYQISKKLKGEMKLLWDFMSYEQVPRTQAVVFRIGYNFK